MDNNSSKSTIKRKWIQKMHMKKGALREELHVPEEKKIPAKKLNAAANSSNTRLSRRANLAKTLRGLRK